MLSKLLFVLLFLYSYVCAKNCVDFAISGAQKIENEGFHRDVNWLFEIISPDILEVVEHKCSFVLKLNMNEGMFVNPDQIADLTRLNKISAYIDGEVNVETITHESETHVVYLFLNTSERMSVTLPIHLRYQRAQITGGYSRVVLEKPTLLMKCEGIAPCGKHRKFHAPCDTNGENICLYRNFNYEPLFNLAEMFIPIGDLDDYPVVSVVSLLLGCAGCIYILSVLSMSPL